MIYEENRDATSIRWRKKMDKKTLRYGIYLLFISLSISILSLLPLYYEQTDTRQGEAVFPEGISKEAVTIQIKTPKDKITLIKEDNLWRVSEADMYYANHKRMVELMKFMEESRIHRPIDLDDKEFQDNFGTNATEITIKGRNNKVLGQLIIGKLTYNNRFAYVRYPDSDKSYLVNHAEKLPEYRYNWLQQPLISIDQGKVQDIIINKRKKDIVIGRDFPTYPFWIIEGNKLIERAYPEDLLSQLEKINFIDVKSAQNFDETTGEALKKFQVTTFNGLIVEFTLIKSKKEYWLKQRLTATSLPTEAVREYIKTNEPLSNYWYFRLSSYSGSKMWNTDLLK